MLCIRFQTFSNFCCRVIDDIFLLWNESKIQLLDFITRLNCRHQTIKFDFKYLKSSVYKPKEKNKLVRTIYWKPTYRKNVLDLTSAHPKLLSNSITFC